MPKDYRDRRIDDKPPKVITRGAARTTTAVDPLGGDGGGMGETLIPVGGEATARVRPGDGVLWFWRRDTSSGAPSGRNVTLKNIDDSAVTGVSYASLPGGWANYITSCAGNFEYATDGVTPVTDETVYAIWDQFVGFTGGDYKFVFTTSTGSVARAILIHGVNPASPGAFYAGMSQSPTWERTYSSLVPAEVIDHFDITVPTGGSVGHMVYGIWQVSGTTDAPTAIYSAPGMTLLSYTMTNPVDPPALRKRTMITFVGDTLPTTASILIPGPFEAGWAGEY